MMTIRQIDRLWSGKSYARLASELLTARQEASFGVEGLDRPCAVAALALVRMDELGQTHCPLYGVLVRAILAGRDRDGGWGDPQTTALCVRALLLGQGGGVAIDEGLAFLASMQRDDGLWPNGPMRRMPGDEAVTLFVLYQLGDNARFRQAVRFNEAVGWFSRNVAQLSDQCRALAKWATLRCRTFGPPAPATLFAA